jgi:type VI secretion system secreted protein Hcp
MALDAQLMLVGERQGLFLGPGSGRHEAESRVFSVNHEIVAPRSPATGLTTGKRHHKPLTLRRDVSVASIAIRQAFVSNEILTEVRLRFYQPAPLGTPKQHYTIQLFNAHVCALRMVLPDTRAHTKTGPIALYEEVSFAYLSIQWTWNDPQMVADDDWMIAR